MADLIACMAFKLAAVSSAEVSLYLCLCVCAFRMCSANNAGLINFSRKFACSSCLPNQFSPISNALPVELTDHGRQQFACNYH